MTTNEVQDTLLSDKEIEERLIEEGLNLVNLWHKADPKTPNRTRVLSKLRERYRDKVTKTLTKYNLSGSVHDTDSDY
jgi:hypothetical protein